MTRRRWSKQRVIDVIRERDLLGLPLARPLRRAVAMLIDLIAIAILTGAGWFFLGLGLAYSLFRFAGRPSRGAISKGSRWITFGSLGSLVLVVTLAGGWRSCFSAAWISAVPMASR